MTAQPMILLTIISEAILEDMLVDDVTELGAKGYTITDARGRGSHGLRSGNWRKEGNIRMEVVGDANLCSRIIARLHATYEQDYGLLMFTNSIELQN